jgi:hypothetical protein
VNIWNIFTLLFKYGNEMRNNLLPQLFATHSNVNSFMHCFSIKQFNSLTLSPLSFNFKSIIVWESWIFKTQKKFLSTSNKFFSIFCKTNEMLIALYSLTHSLTLSLYSFCAIAFILYHSCLRLCFHSIEGW